MEMTIKVESKRVADLVASLQEQPKSIDDIIGDVIGDEAEVTIYADGNIFSWSKCCKRWFDITQAMNRYNKED